MSPEVAKARIRLALEATLEAGNALPSLRRKKRWLRVVVELQQQLQEIDASDKEKKQAA